MLLELKQDAQKGLTKPVARDTLGRSCKLKIQVKRTPDAQQGLLLGIARFSARTIARRQTWPQGWPAGLIPQRNLATAPYTTPPRTCSAARAAAR